MDARAVAALIDASLQQPKATDDEAWFADATQSAKPPPKPKPLRLERPGNAPLDDLAPARHVLSAALHAAATRLQRIGGLFGVAERASTRGPGRRSPRARPTTSGTRASSPPAPGRGGARGAAAWRREGDAAVAPEPVMRSGPRERRRRADGGREARAWTPPSCATRSSRRYVPNRCRAQHLQKSRALDASVGRRRLLAGARSLPGARTRPRLPMMPGRRRSRRDAVAAYRGANVPASRGGEGRGPLLRRACAARAPEPGKEPVRRAEADAARFTASAAAARGLGGGRTSPSSGPRSPAPSWLYKKPRASARRARRRCGASSARRCAPPTQDAGRVPRPTTTTRSLDERSATRRAAALRAQPSAVGGVWACEGVYGTRRAVACVSRNARWF